MTEETHPDGLPEGSGAERVPMALWKKALAVLSLLLGGAGVALGGFSGPSDRAPENQAAGAAGGATTISPSSLGPGIGVGQPGLPGAQDGAAEDEATTLWAPLLAKGGLSFFIAFCIGYALRTFLRGTMLVIGVVALCIFALQKAGIIDGINWERAQGYWDDLTAGLGEQFESFKTFVTGSLPSAASGGVGLVAGFRR